MNINKIIFLLLPFINLSYGQNRVIEYKMLLNKSNTMENRMFDAYPKTEENLKLVSLSLVYNKDEMIFYIKKIPKIVQDDIGSSLLITDIQGIYHRKSNSEDMFIEIEKYGSQENFIVKKKSMTLWNITKEKKMICGYECIKATTTFDVDSDENEVKNRLSPIIAWYCPKLNYSYGPKGIGGLPGVILELEYISLIYTAVKINDKDNNDIISLPKEKKIITESQMFEGF